MHNETRSPDSAVPLDAPCRAGEVRLEQILFALREVLASEIDSSARDLADNDNLYDWIATHADDVDVWDVISAEFGCEINADAWQEFFDFHPGVDSARWNAEVRPTLTLVRFASRLAPHVECGLLGEGLFEPVRIAGTVCQKAGAFRGIQSLVARVAPANLRIAPSTPLRRLAPRDLEKVWRILRWITIGALPPLDWPYRRWAGACFYLGLGWLAVSLLLGKFGGLLAPSVLCAVGTLVKIWGLAWKLNWAGNPLPAEIQTFRDLSERVASALPAAER